MASNVPGGEKHFVDQHREKLIQRITMIHPVLDILLQEGLLTQEHYDTVKTKKTPQEKMRGLYKYSRGWSFTDKDIFYRALQASNPGVMEHLKGTSLSGLRKIVADDRIQELSIQYMTSMKERYGRVKEHNSRIGESVNLDKRYTQLLLIKNYQNQQEREFGISSIRPLQRRDDRSSAEDSPTTIQALFDPDKDGFTPKIVVLQGPAGIGKTMTSQKIVLDWASGNLFQDCFDFVFSLSCRELNNIPRNISLAGLLSRLCTLQCPEEMMRSVLSNPRKLLFIIDGLDELRWSLEDPSEVCEDPFQETHLKVILRSLLNKQVLYGSSAIVTTRPFVLKELENLLQQSRHVEILGFTEEDCEKYVYNFFDDKDVAEKVLGLIKENRIIFAMCSIPISCWIVCTVMKQEMKRDFDLSRCRTTTSIYVLYLKGLIKYHGRKQLVLTCLRRVCALANEGVFRKQILFEEADLRRHGLSMTEVESVFLNESIFHRDIGVSTSYGFIHLTVQEFFAALYYVLEEALTADQKVSRAKEVLSSPHMYFGKRLIRTFNVLPHLSLMVQFLYGLSDINQAKELSEILSCDISFQATPAMRSWLGSFSLYVELTDDRLCCLYEMQDENVVRKVMSVMEFFKVSFSRDMNCVRQLVYFLKNCKPFQRMKFSCEKMDSKDLQMLSPFLQKCSLIQFSCSDSIVSEGLLSLMSTSKSLKKLVLFRPPLEDFEVCDLCDALRRPGCTLEMVRFCCNLNQKTCDKIYSLHGIQTKLDVMFYIEDEMSVYEAQGKFERLRLLGRVLHTCSLWCQRLNQLIGYKVTDDDGDEEIWIYTLSLSTVSQTCLSTVPASLVQFQHDPSSLGPPIHRCALPVWVENLFILRSYFSPS